MRPFVLPVNQTTPFVHHEIVRMRALLDGVSLEITFLGIEIGDEVSLLADEPHAALRVGERIARTRVLRERRGPGFRFGTERAGLARIGLRGCNDWCGEEEQQSGVGAHHGLRDGWA